MRLIDFELFQLTLYQNRNLTVLTSLAITHNSVHNVDAQFAVHSSQGLRSATSTHSLKYRVSSLRY